MRRLRRVCAAVGSKDGIFDDPTTYRPHSLDRHVRYVSCSATIAQPLKHMRAIFGIEVRPPTLLLAVVMYQGFSGHRGHNSRRCALGTKRIPNMDFPSPRPDTTKCRKD